MYKQTDIHTTTKHDFYINYMHLNYTSHVSLHIPDLWLAVDKKSHLTSENWNNEN